MSNSDRPDEAVVSQLSDEADLDAFVSGTDLALVEFYTEGCGICQSMVPVVGNLARELGAVGTINPRDDPPLLERFDVRGVPLFVLFVDGQRRARLADGFVGGDDLTAWIGSHTDAALGEEPDLSVDRGD